MYWFDAIATRNFPYVIRLQNAAHGDQGQRNQGGYCPPNFEIGGAQPPTIHYTN